MHIRNRYRSNAKSSQRLGNVRLPGLPPTELHKVNRSYEVRSNMNLPLTARANFDSDKRYSMSTHGKSPRIMEPVSARKMPPPLVGQSLQVSTPRLLVDALNAEPFSCPCVDAEPKARLVRRVGRVRSAAAREHNRPSAASAATAECTKQEVQQQHGTPKLLCGRKLVEG